MGSLYLIEYSLDFAKGLWGDLIDIVLKIKLFQFHKT